MLPATSACCCPTRPSASVVASRTMNLSLGERPVCWPVSATSAPCAVSRASPRADRLLVESRRAEDCSGPCPMVVRPTGSIPQAGLRTADSCIGGSLRSSLRHLVPDHLRTDLRRHRTVRNRKAERYQIINRFKDFEIRLNRLYDKEKADGLPKDCCDLSVAISQPSVALHDWEACCDMSRRSVPQFVPNLSRNSRLLAAGRDTRS